MFSTSLYLSKTCFNSWSKGLRGIPCNLLYLSLQQISHIHLTASILRHMQYRQLDFKLFEDILLNVSKRLCYKILHLLLAQCSFIPCHTLPGINL